MLAKTDKLLPLDNSLHVEDKRLLNFSREKRRLSIIGGSGLIWGFEGYRIPTKSVSLRNVDTARYSTKAALKHVMFD